MVRTAVAVLAALAAACASTPPGASTARSAPAVDDLIDDPARWIGQRVVVRAYLVGRIGGCVDMVCPAAQPCCGCGAEAKLATRADESDPERLLEVVAPADDPIGCRLEPSCGFDCTPPAGVVVELTGRLRRVGSSWMHYFEVESHRVP
jgi:hypothetical protein